MVYLCIGDLGSTTHLPAFNITCAFTCTKFTSKFRVMLHTTLNASFQFYDIKRTMQNPIYRLSASLVSLLVQTRYCAIEVRYRQYAGQCRRSGTTLHIQMLTSVLKSFYIVNLQLDCKNKFWRKVTSLRS